MKAELETPLTARRTMLGLAASAGCFLLAGRPANAQSVEGDLAILSAALWLEHEGIAAYQAGAESGLLSPGILKVAVAFQSDHKHHRDGIIGAIGLLGGTAIGPDNQYSFGRLRNENDILRLAWSKEKGAVVAYSTLAANIQNRTVLNVGANVLVDEVRHLTVLNSVLGIPNF